MKIYEDLERRELIAQVTGEEEIRKRLDNDKVVFYIGFDATADSLHVGHLLQLLIIRRMIDAGHTPILLLGTGTTLVGDPTGKTDMRKMLSAEEIDYNADRFLDQMRQIVDIDKCIVARNGDWLKQLGYIEFLRDYGPHFSVNKMLTAECIRSRLERGCTFLEFNYMIMQSYDFLELNRRYGCLMQLGGDDQWSNILGGVDLVRRVEDKEVYGMTFQLLTTKEGKKMGKTEGGAVWLSPNRTSPFEFFQYWRNVDDADVIKCLKFLTFLPVEEIEEMERTMAGSDLNQAKETLAYEVTKIVHGEDEAAKALATAHALFSEKASSDHMPTVELTDDDFTDGKILVTDALIKTGLTKSRGEGKRLIADGGIYVNDEKIEDASATLEKTAFEREIILKKGKKVFYKLFLK
ncbi:MAG TPA: tyrosine--tRNA ligase [Oscillospiraceae bacterium]|nr:tyrosine--tRNA ligase [Oscillospiraceae bacterium]